MLDQKRRRSPDDMLRNSPVVAEDNGSNEMQIEGRETRVKECSMEGSNHIPDRLVVAVGNPWKAGGDDCKEDLTELAAGNWTSRT